MGTPKAKKTKLSPADAATPKLDLDPDAWPKFEALVKSAAKMGHKPHIKKSGNLASPRKLK
jgi:hypothetical protein